MMRSCPDRVHKGGVGFVNDADGPADQFHYDITAGFRADYRVDLKIDVVVIVYIVFDPAVLFVAVIDVFQ